MDIVSKLTAATALGLALSAGSAFAQTSQPFQPTGSTTSERILTEREINDLVMKAQQQGYNASAAGADIRYVGGSDISTETNVCCENVIEDVKNTSDVQVTEIPIDAVTERQIIEPRVIKNIQPVEIQRAVGRTESITQDTVYSEETLPVRVVRDPVPELTVTQNEQVTVNDREERTQTTYDAVGRREITQPIVKTTVVPVQRRITRHVEDVQTLPTRYEQVVAPVERRTVAIPQMVESYSSPTTETTEREVTETVVDYVSQRDVYQPRVVTEIQPIEYQILRPTTDEVVNDPIYRQEVLPGRVETIPAPAVEEVIIPQYTENTVFEVQDVYIDQINRKIIQPVEIKTVYPVEQQVLSGRVEVIERDTVYTENRLPVIVEADAVPQTVVNYIPSETREYREDTFNTYFDAVTHRNITQPVIIERVQPIEVRSPSLRTEYVTAPVEYRTERAAMVVMNVGDSCNCHSVY